MFSFETHLSAIKNKEPFHIQAYKYIFTNIRDVLVPTHHVSVTKKQLHLIENTDIFLSIYHLEEVEENHYHIEGVFPMPYDYLECWMESVCH